MHPWSILILCIKSTNRKTPWNDSSFKRNWHLVWSSLWRKGVLPTLCRLPLCGPPSTLHFLIWCQRYQRKSLNCPQQNAAKSAVRRTETRRGSRAGSVELLCARNTFESSSQTAERLEFHAICFLLCNTCQRWYYVKEISLSARVVCPSLQPSCACET